MLGTRDQTKLSVTYTRGRLPRLFHPSVLGCSLRTALLQRYCSKFAPIALFTSRLTEVFAYFWRAWPAAGRAVSPTVSNFKIPEQSPLNYLLISQIGSNLLQKCANLSGFSAGHVTLHNSKANTRMARKSLIPSVLAC